MVVYGDPSSLVGLTVELTTIGPVPVTVGQGIVGLVGYATRGPANEAVGLGTALDAKRLYYAGDLKEAIELAFAQGVPVVYAVRVLGVGNQKASATATDGNSQDVVEFEAISEGIWGNSLTVKILDGDFKGTDVEIFPGDGTVGPYYLKMWDLVEDSSNRVYVNNISRTIVYDPDDFGAGKVLVDKDTGSIEFYTGEAPAATDQIRASIKYKTRKIIVSDGETTEVFNNIRDLVDLEAKVGNSNLVRAHPIYGETHLPKADAFALTGGSDGDPISVDDWERALNILGDTITPTTVALTSYEVGEGSYDLIPILDGWLKEMADRFQPCLGFVGVRENEPPDKILDLCAGYNNRLLSIVANPWDTGSPRQNGAVARAAQEAVCALGESAAKASNAISGMNDLLVIFSRPTVNVLTEGGADVLIKKRGVPPYEERGISPYIGISTATDWQFKRCVDNRTINWVIVALKYITDQYYHWKNTPTTRAAIRASIDTILREQVEYENIRTYKLDVLRHPTDPNKVVIHLMMENIGHCERFEVKMGVGLMGVYEEETAA